MRTRIYSLAKADDPPATEFLNFSQAAFNGVHSNDFSFFEEVASIVADEPAQALDPERAGQLAAIGIAAGKPFAPDERMRAILDEAARIGAGIVRSLVFAPRDPDVYYYPDSTWATAFVGGSHEFLANGARLLDARAMMHYVGTGITPAMATPASGSAPSTRSPPATPPAPGSTAGATTRSRCPRGSPPRRSGRSTSTTPRRARCCKPTTPTPASTAAPTMRFEDNGDLIIRFGPTAPDGRDGNWIQTRLDKGWFPILRIYGPLQSWFDKTWRPGEITPAGDAQA